ncbi:MAG: GAF domain-containing protein, partial [Chitinophagaceae bacterium]
AEDYKAQFELEQITHYFSSSLAGKRSEDEIVSDVAARLISSLHYEDCIIYLWNDDKTRMIQKAAVGPKEEEDLIRTSSFDVLPGQGIVGHVMNTRKPLLVNDTSKDPRYRVDDRFRLSELTVPVIHNGELLGVIDSEHSEANYFNDRDVKIMTTIATLLGNKLKQLESEHSLEAKQIELAGINGQLAEARLSALQAQMNPHFVFNALNSIKRMILEGENDTASRYLSKFALMIRMTLEHSKETFVTLHDNVQYLKAYLEMERLRFDQNFTYLIDVDESVEDAEISLPPMMIQPLVENAIWHGLMYSDAEKKLKIGFVVVSNRLRCVVEDNGIGIRQSEELRKKSRPFHRSVGLENLRKRISIMNEKYKTDCTLTITDLKEMNEEDGGTAAVLEMNIITA